MERRPDRPHLGYGGKKIMSGLVAKRLKLSNGKKEMLDVRKWEDMNQDCLVEIFKKVGGLKSLAIDLPCVCKLWYKATLNPVLWTSLDFKKLYDEIPPWKNVRVQVADGTFRQSIRFQEIIKRAVDRSCGTAVECMLPESCDLKDLHYILDRSPALKFLDIPSLVLKRYHSEIPEMIGKLEALEFLQWGHAVCCGDYSIEETLRQISMHCPKFSTLTIYGYKGYVEDNEVAALTRFIPTIKCLKLRNVYIDILQLENILSGCKELEKLDVSHCVNFEENNKEILKLASHIKSFKCKGFSDCNDVFVSDDEEEDDESEFCSLCGDDDEDDEKPFTSDDDESESCSLFGDDGDDDDEPFASDVDESEFWSLFRDDDEDDEEPFASDDGVPEVSASDDEEVSASF